MCRLWTRVHLRWCCPEINLRGYCASKEPLTTCTVGLWHRSGNLPALSPELEKMINGVRTHLRACVLSQSPVSFKNLSRNQVQRLFNRSLANAGFVGAASTSFSPLWLWIKSGYPTRYELNLQQLHPGGSSLPPLICLAHPVVHGEGQV